PGGSGRLLVCGTALLAENAVHDESPLLGLVVATFTLLPQRLIECMFAAVSSKSEFVTLASNPNTSPSVLFHLRRESASAPLHSDVPGGTVEPQRKIHRRDGIE